MATPDGGTAPPDSASGSELPNAAAAGTAVKPKKTYKQLAMPTPEQIYNEDLMNNCGVRTVVAAVMGVALGAAFGVFMGVMDTSAPGDGMAAGAETQTVRQVVRQMVTTTRMRMVSYMKGFTMVGALFSATECVIEKFRAKHDIYNVGYAGCATGSILAYSAGPKAMCAGCVGFAAFSVAMEKFMER